MNLYQQLGYLVLGSRLRRLSESFLSEINRIYQNQGVDFDASWFPVFYLLSQNDSLSIKELSDKTEVSHPAASQLITNLKNRNLVETSVSTDDGRRQMVQFTEKGKQLLQQILPVWDAISNCMTDFSGTDAQINHLLPAITAMENEFKEYNLSGKVSEQLNTGANGKV